MFIKQISFIFSEDILLVGTKEGHLLQYRAKEPRRGKRH